MQEFPCHQTNLIAFLNWRRFYVPFLYVPWKKNRTRWLILPSFPLVGDRSWLPPWFTLTCWWLLGYKINWVQPHPEGTNFCILFWIQPFFKLQYSGAQDLVLVLHFLVLFFSSNCTFCISPHKFAPFHFKFQNWDKWLMCLFNMKMNLASKFSLSSLSPYLPVTGHDWHSLPSYSEHCSPGALPFPRASPTPLMVRVMTTLGSPRCSCLWPCSLSYLQ